MCGRFTHKFSWKELHDLLSKGRWPARLAAVGRAAGERDSTGEEGDAASRASLFEPRFNVAPTQNAPVIRVALEDGKATALEVAALRWGLAPHWAKDPKTGPINARAETVATNAMFRAAFASRRCIVPVSGFYEWKPSTIPQLWGGSEPVEGPKQPMYITRADGHPLLLAGLWERWGKAEEEAGIVETFTIITTTANAFMSSVHDRMPVVLEPETVERWLDPQTPAARLAELFRPAPDGVLQMHAVSTRVNNPRNQGAELAEAIIA